MEVILLEKINNLGDLGDVVAIKSGYGRNYLVPQGKASLATAQKIAEFDAIRAELELAQAEKLAAANERYTALHERTVSIACKAGEGGKLFGSVGAQNIADAISDNGNKVEKHEVRLPDGVLRKVGNYPVDVQLYPNITATVNINLTDAEE